LIVEVAVPFHDPIVRRLEQAKEQGDRKEHPEPIQPVTDLWLYPSTQATQITHCDLKSASVGDSSNNKNPPA
jgi:hypothetical protein